MLKIQNICNAVRVKEESPNTYEDIDKVIKDIFAKAQIKYKKNI